MVCVPISGTELLKPLEFPVIRMIKVFCYANQQFWKAPEDRVWLPVEPIIWLEGWSVPPPTSGKEAGGWPMV